MTLHTTEHHLEHRLTFWSCYGFIMGLFFFWKKEHFFPRIFASLRSYMYLLLGCATLAFWFGPGGRFLKWILQSPHLWWFGSCHVSDSRHNLHFFPIKMQQVRRCTLRLYLKYLSQIQFTEPLPKGKKHPQNAYNVDIWSSAAAIALHRSTLTGLQFLLTNDELFCSILTLIKLNERKKKN